MNIQNIPIRELKLLERNPRKITQEQMDRLCQSLKDDPSFLQSRPVLVNKKEEVLEVYAGNQRVRAAKWLGWKEVPCIVEEDLDQETMKSRILKDNKTYGMFDWDLIAGDYDIEMLLGAGFTLQDLDLMDKRDEKPKKVKKKEKEEDEDKKCQMCPSCGYEF
jgi:ParB-like chromosome segregation protein Spo0J